MIRAKARFWPHKDAEHIHQRNKQFGDAELLGELSLLSCVENIAFALIKIVNCIIKPKLFQFFSQQNLPTLNKAD